MVDWFHCLRSVCSEAGHVVGRIWWSRAVHLKVEAERLYYLLKFVINLLALFITKSNGIFPILFKTHLGNEYSITKNIFYFLLQRTYVNRYKKKYKLKCKIFLFNSVLPMVLIT
jgi:hypothetical protein